MAEGGHTQASDNWKPSDDHLMGSRGDVEVSGSVEDSRAGQAAENADYPRSSSVDVSISGSKAELSYREKQVKPNKVYIGGLPEHTRQEDLQSCFGKIGKIVNIELKAGYGFVEFDVREAAEESVAKYHEGYFMGNKIRVELSRGGGRTAKYSSDPGACFKCGQMGHWARECPNYPPGSHRRSHNRSPSDSPLIDRIQPSRHYPPPPSRDYPSYRDEPPSSRYGRDPRYDYPPHLPSGRELRRPVTPPPREHRDYPPRPPSRSSRDYDRDYRSRAPPAPPHRYDSYPGYYPPESEGPASGYAQRSYGAPPPSRDVYERRLPPPADRYTYATSTRPRTPPAAPPPRVREEYERPASQRYYDSATGPVAPTDKIPRDYPPPDYRGRPISPPPARYASDYPPRPPSPEVLAHRYRRRSASPPPRPLGNGAYEPAGYGGYSGNGYANNVSGGSSVSNLPPRVSGGSRDYPSRNGREETGSYRRP